MRDNYFNRMNCMRLPLKERGFVATLWNLGDQIAAPYDDIDVVMGNGWKPIADRLALMRLISMVIKDNWVYLKLLHPNAKERAKNKASQLNKKGER